MLHKILFINPYFGKWPTWFPAFLQSCKYNPSINWLFLTDAAIPNISISNVEFIHFTLDHFNLLASKKLGFNVQIRSPYKLCDFKPTYGLLFDNYLKNYDFWGHCDIDTVLGDIRKFITPDILSESEIVSAQQQRICGHFCLYKNNEKIAKIFTSNPYHQFFLESKFHHGFDEGGMTETIKTLAERGEVKIHWPKRLANFTNPVDNGATSYLRPYTNRWYWEKGKLYNRTDEIMYMHFMTWKNSLKDCQFDYSDSPESFYISYSHIGLKKSNMPSLALQAASLVAWNYDFWPRRIRDLRHELKYQGSLHVFKKLISKFMIKFVH